jgi:hypothetical protein
VASFAALYRTGLKHAGFLDDFVHGGLLCAGIGLCPGMPEVEVVDERGHDRGFGLVCVAPGVSGSDAVVSGEVLK